MTYLRMVGKQADALKWFRDLSKSDQLAAMAARAIYRAMKPKASVRAGKGNIQVKTIRRYQYTLSGAKVLDDDGNRKFKAYGSYLYLRLWVSGGDRDNSKRQYKSYYIGGENEANDRTVIYPYRALADAYHETFKVITTKAGDHRLKKTPETYDLESKIMSCIDIGQSPPRIDHESLKRLQDEVAR